MHIILLIGSPLPPQNVSVRNTEVAGQVNISWTATTVMGVDQKYTIFFGSQIAETAEAHFNYYIYEQNTSNFNIRCSVYVIAVNGAGKSDPSNNVTIPSLPDIGPVTTSLSHQVWKSAGGEIMVNVSFKVIRMCINCLIIVSLTPNSQPYTVRITQYLHTCSSLYQKSWDVYLKSY